MRGLMQPLTKRFFQEIPVELSRLPADWRIFRSSRSALQKGKRLPPLKQSRGRKEDMFWQMCSDMIVNFRGFWVAWQSILEKR